MNDVFIDGRRVGYTVQGCWRYHSRVILSRNKALLSYPHRKLIKQSGYGGAGYHG
jgi:hypothetical protein